MKMTESVVLSSDRASAFINHIYTFLDVEMPVDSVKILSLSSPVGGTWIGTEEELLKFLSQISSEEGGYNGVIGNFNFSAQTVIFKIECHLLKIRFSFIKPLVGLLPTDVGLLDLNDPGCNQKWCNTRFFFSFDVENITSDN